MENTPDQDETAPDAPSGRDVDPAHDRHIKFYPLAEMSDRELALATVKILEDALRDAVTAWAQVFRLPTAANSIEGINGLDEMIAKASVLGLFQDDPEWHLESDLRAYAKIADLVRRDIGKVNLTRNRYSTIISGVEILRYLDRNNERPPASIADEVIQLNLRSQRDRLCLGARMLDYKLLGLREGATTTPFYRLGATSKQTLEREDEAYRAALLAFEKTADLIAETSRRYGGIPSATSRIAWSSVLVTRLTVIGTSLRKLLPASSYSSALGDTAWDESSISSLVRSIIECVFLLYYVGIEDVNEDEWTARQNLMFLHDCTSRLRVIYYDEFKHVEQREFYERERTQLAYKLSSSSYFQSLPEKRRIEFLKGRKLTFISQDEIIERMGASAVDFRRSYELLSSHVHTLPLSFYDQLESGHGRGVEHPHDKAAITQVIGAASGLLEIAAGWYEDLFTDSSAAESPAAPS